MTSFPVFSEFWPLYFLAVVASSGILSSLFGICKTIIKIAFLKRYIRKLRHFSNLNGFDRAQGELGDWLAERSAVLQHDMGGWGKGLLPIPGVGHVQNYPILTNTITKIRNDLAEQEEIITCIDCLLHYKGILKNHLWEYLKGTINPILWLRNGVQSILLVPFWLLKILGLTNERSIEKAERSRALRIITALLFCLTLFSSFVSIVSGWSAFMLFIHQWMPKI